jgi:large subunit ribosomal protein L23
MEKTMTLKPRLSEKSYALSQVLRTYVFEVPVGSSKQSIAAAVASQFKVTVTKVNVANSDGKVKRTVRKGGRPVMGQRARTRRAYVTLKEGDSLPVFAAVEESEKAEEKATEMATKATKGKKEAK